MRVFDYKHQCFRTDVVWLLRINTAAHGASKTVDNIIEEGVQIEEHGAARSVITEHGITYKPNTKCTC